MHCLTSTRAVMETTEISNCIRFVSAIFRQMSYTRKKNSNAEPRDIVFTPSIIFNWWVSTYKYQETIISTRNVAITLHCRLRPAVVTALLVYFRFRINLFYRCRCLLLSNFVYFMHSDRHSFSQLSRQLELYWIWEGHHGQSTALNSSKQRVLTNLKFCAPKQMKTKSKNKSSHERALKCQYIVTWNLF